jgi:hypothetical protein
MQGKHELNITVTVLAGSAITADGVRAPATDVIFSQSVVFYKLVQRPTLALKPLTCSLDRKRVASAARVPLPCQSQVLPVVITVPLAGRGCRPPTGACLPRFTQD